MNIFLTGAGGFVGAAVQKALERSGHRVWRGVRKAKTGQDVAVDFEHDVNAAVWLPKLRVPNGQSSHAVFDAVVNAVGVLGGAEAQMMAVHAEAPGALAAACAQLGIRRFVQVSALGVSAAGTTRYYRSKFAGEQAVRAALPGAHIVRPSLIYGAKGDSSQMFRQLTQLPLILLPQAGRMAVQPVHVVDVAQAVLKLVEDTTQSSNSQGSNSQGRSLTLLGAEALSLADYLGSLARQLGRRPPYVLALPAPVATLSAQLMQHLPQHVWTPDTLAMLQAGSTGSAQDVQAMQALLGRPVTALADFVNTAE